MTDDEVLETFPIGEKVAYSRAFLRNTGMITG